MERTTVNRRYRVDQRIGEGGMAVVYLGRDLLLNRAVAVKALRRQYAADPNFRARFEREAQAAAGFTHPNIIGIYDVGEEGGVPYIVMEYVRGPTLKEIIAQEGPFAPEDVAALLEQVASALDYAHERGLIHRDIKPQNILVTPDGAATVVDFGIAKGLADGDLTDVGAGLGTVHYISPEQASGLMATPASDIYSLGVVAFEMLTRSLPFDADTAVGVAMRHVHDAPPRPSSRNPSVPPAVDEIVLRALAKDPTRRFATAGQFAEAMSGWERYASPSQATLIGPARTAPRTSGGATSRNGAGSASVSPGHPGTTPAVPNAQSARTASSPRGNRRPPRDDGPGTTWLVGTIGLVALIALIYGAFRFSPRFSHSDSPNGARATATSRPPAAGVVTTAITTVLAETVPAPAPPEPTVASAQAPTVASGTAGDGTVDVPDLTGHTFDEATAMLTDRGLLLQEVGSVFSQTVPAGSIAEQDPPPNQRVPQGATISVKRSLGTGAINLSALNLVGSNPDQATQTLQQQGLNVQRDQVASTSVPEGEVAGVDPPSAQVGGTVTLHVSVGAKVQIPGALQGMPLDQAEAQLRDLGLVIAGTQGVSRATIEAQHVDLDQLGIKDHDVVGVQDNGAALGAWVPPGTSITVVYYDATLGS